MTAAFLLVLAALLVRRERSATAPAADALPVTLDLTAAGLRAGRTLAVALRAATAGCGDRSARTLDRVAALLQLGATSDEAWDLVGAHPDLLAVSRAARRSATSGMRLAAAFEEVAAELRRDRAAAAEARAARAGVWAIAPLGLCFLPAFVCLGVVPVVIGIARAALG